MAQTFDVDLRRLGAVSEALREALKAERATDKEIRQTLLLVEEITVKFSECMPDAPVTAQLRRSFGKSACRSLPMGRSTIPSAKRRTGLPARRTITAR